MAPSARVKAAFQAMRNIGISEQKTKPALKQLLKLFDKNWDLIEEENYRVLADAIFEYEDTEAADKEKKIPAPTDQREALEEESQMQDEPERPLKRLRLKHQGQQGTLSHGQPSPSSGTVLKIPKPEPGEPEALPFQQVQPMTGSPYVSPQSVARNKGKRPISPQNMGVLAERSPPSAPLHIRDKRVTPERASQALQLKENKVEPAVVLTSKHKQSDTGALIKVKDEPFTDDMVSLEPLTVVLPEHSHPEPRLNISIPVDKKDDQQPGAFKSVEGIDKGAGTLADVQNSSKQPVAFKPTTEENHVKEADVPVIASNCPQICMQLNIIDTDNHCAGRDIRSTDDMNMKSLVAFQEQQQLDNDGTGCVNDVRNITRDQESVKVSLEKSNCEFLPSFQYIAQNVVSHNADVKFSLAQIGDQDCCVSCNGDCLSSSSLPCNCAQRNGGESPYTSDGLIREFFLEECISMVQNPNHYLTYCKECPIERLKNEDMSDPCKGHLKHKFIKECWTKCGCSRYCGNRVVQRGITCNLQVFRTEGKGWGLRTLEDLPRGAFVCEYVGEILTITELQKRNTRRSNDKHSYSVILDTDWGSRALKEEEVLCLDATFYGNVARFINHRCADANLIEIPVEVETLDHHYYHVALFTTRKIDAFEELTWDYGVDFDDNEQHIKAFRCLCGSKFCRNMKRSSRSRSSLTLR